MNFEVIGATAEQIPEICAMLGVQLEEHGIPISEERLRTAVSGVLVDPSRGFFLVACHSGKSIGVAYVSFIWALEHGGRSAWLEELYVEPSCRGEGAGAKLLEGVLARCESEGCQAIDVEIDAAHERVWTLYQRYGFVSLPRRRIVKKLERLPSS